MDDRPNLFLMTNTLETGGSERQFVGLAGAISPERFQTHLGCLRRYGPLMAQLKEIAEFPLGGSFFTRQAWRSHCALAGMLRAKKIAVAHAFDLYSNVTLLPMARLAGVPVIVGSHRQLGDLLTPAQSFAQAAAFHFCDRVVCNSQAAAGRLSQHGVPARKLVVIPNGLAREAFAPAVPILPRVEGIVRVGMIARMNVLYKNQAAFLRAAARVSQRCAGAEFVLVGDGPFRSEFARMAQELGLGSRVRFLGERHDIPAVLSALDLTVVSSISESLPNVILESMAAGVPVVATRVGGIPEIVEHEQTGLLVPPDDDDQLADAIESLIRQPSLRMYCRRRAREYAASNFHWNRVANQYEDMYCDLLAQKEKRWRGRLSSARKGLKARLRVFIVGPSLRQLGGQSVQVDLLLHHWRSDSEIEARFIPIDPELSRRLGWVNRIPYLRTLFREMSYARALSRGLKDADIVHVFVASYASFLIVLVPALLFARARGTKLLVHYHSGEALDHLRRSRVARRILMRIDGVAVPSGYLADVFCEFGVTAQIVPNITDLDQFSFRQRDTVQPRLICTRGFHPYYRVDLILRAFANLQQTFPLAQLCLVGEGPLEKEMRRLSQEFRLARVEFVGPVSRDRIARYYDQANQFINASSVDNMPVSILEAFASGTPVVTTAAGGIAHIVEHERTGLLCEPGDWKSLAENAMRLVREPSLARRLAANAYEESQRYRWENVRSQWFAVYQRLLGASVPVVERGGLAQKSDHSKLCNLS